MKHTVSIFVVAVLFWLGNSGFYTPLLLTLGLVSVVFVVLLARRINVVDEESQPLHLAGRALPAYYGWLLLQIVRANVDVVCRIWRGNGSISPVVAMVPAAQKSDMGKVVYANSITLTPGTVAMDLDGDRILVHALTGAGIEELEAGEMNRRVARLERQA